MRTAAVGTLTLTETGERAGERLMIDVGDAIYGFVGTLSLPEPSFEALLARDNPDLELDAGVAQPGTEHGGEPFITISFGPMATQVRPDELRAFGHNCFAAASEAEAHADLLETMTEILGISEERAVEALLQTRRKEDDGRPRDDD